MTGFQKRKISLRYWLQGREYHQALKAMEFGEKLHNGVRKDKITPEFDHQISIAHYVRSLTPSLLFKEETLTTVFLHDTREDYGVSHEEIERIFGAQVAHSVGCLTKKFRGVAEDQGALFERMAEDPIASIVKAADRVHNLQSMVGVFTEEKQRRYIEEVNLFFLPMIKQARRRFPQQELAYENVKHVLISQMDLIQAGLDAVGKKAA